MEDSTVISALATNFVPLDHPLGKRINVRGGGGKTSLARALAQELSSPFIEIDAINWLPNWIAREPEDFRRETEKVIEAAGESWVVDGNYSEDMKDIVLSRSDTVVWLDLPWRVMFRRIFFRSLARAIDKKVICGSNTESWRLIFSRKSLWWWYIANRRRLISRGERFLPMVPDHVPVIRIRSVREQNEFYRIHGLERQ